MADPAVFKEGFRMETTGAAPTCAAIFAAIDLMTARELKKLVERIEAARNSMPNSGYEKKVTDDVILSCCLATDKKAIA